MTIYALRTILEEIKEEDMLSDLKDEKKKEGYVLVGHSDETAEILNLAGIVYDGEINLKKIEFCKVESQQECLAGTLRIPKITDICGSKYKIQFFVGNSNLVIIDDTKFTQNQIFRIKLKRTKQGQTREQFLYNYFAGIISCDLEMLSRYERQIMKLDDEVIDHKYENYQSQVSTIRKQLLTLREYYDELRDLGKQLEEDENHIFSKKNLKFFGTISDRADRLMNRTLHLLDYIGQVRDSYNQKVSEAQNKNMEFLTIVSTIFFPLTLITGWYGMNFQNMPELENGYPCVIALSLIVVGIIIFVFKRRKIL